MPKILVLFLAGGGPAASRGLAGRSDSAAVLLFCIAEKAMRKESLLFCKEMSDCQPEGYSFFMGSFSISGSLPEGYSSFVAERRTKKGATSKFD